MRAAQTQKVDLRPSPPGLADSNSALAKPALLPAMPHLSADAKHHILLDYCPHDTTRSFAALASRHAVKGGSVQQLGLDPAIWQCIGDNKSSVLFNQLKFSGERLPLPVTHSFFQPFDACEDRRTANSRTTCVRLTRKPVHGHASYSIIVFSTHTPHNDYNENSRASTINATFAFVQTTVQYHLEMQMEQCRQQQAECWRQHWAEVDAKRVHLPRQLTRI